MYTVTKDVTFNAAAIFWVTGGPSHASSNTIVIHTRTLETPLGTTRSFKENNRQPAFEMGNLFPAGKEVQDIYKALLLACESNDFRRVTFIDGIRDGVEIVGWNLQTRGTPSATILPSALQKATGSRDNTPFPFSPPECKPAVPEIIRNHPFGIHNYANVNKRDSRWMGSRESWSRVGHIATLHADDFGPTERIRAQASEVVSNTTYTSEYNGIREDGSDPLCHNLRKELRLPVPGGIQTPEGRMPEASLP
ncbi:hypothetical protein B0H13DRAFT_1862831 [Mycena leptocephala]|nr:hypothetical protein B0H13DRAFT_1862831 [Mycena leptocephala]